jgi:hypothetical protein
MSLNDLSRRVSVSPIAQWGVSLPAEKTRRLLYKPPLTKFLLENGANPLHIQKFLWDNKVTAFTLQPGMQVIVSIE